MKTEDVVKKILNAKGCKSLEFIGDDMNEIPREIGLLLDIEELHFKSNDGLKVIPEEIGLLKKLKKLIISNNSVNKLPNSIGNLTELEYLDVSACYLSKIPDSFSNLKNIKYLNLRQNILEEFPDVLCQLKSLEKLDLSYNKISEIPESIEYLQNLEVLLLDGKPFEECDSEEEIGHRLDSLPDQIGNLVKLTELSLQNNWLTKIPNKICKLRNLQILKLSNNFLLKLPSDIDNLHNISELYIDSNRIRTLPVGIKHLKKLKFINFEKNFSNLSGYDMIEKKQFKEFLNDQKKYEKQTREGRLIIIGSGGVGKTTIKNWLVRDAFTKRNPQTRGIDIDLWSVISIQKSEQTRIHLHIWDFGGQIIYRSIHKSYLSNKAIYLLVFDTRGDTVKTIEDFLEIGRAHV